MRTRIRMWRTGREAMLGWAALIVGVMVYEFHAPPGQLLSEGIDRALLRYPNMTRFVVTIVALHLLNLIPQSIDPLHRVATVRAGSPRGMGKNRSAGSSAPGMAGSDG